MPFVANTPESLIARSDSKDPKSTCRGITSAGRPCRRPLGTRSPSDAATERYGGRGTRLLDAVPDDDPADENLYCWQHKEQASLSARSSPGPKGSIAVPTIREERTSLDTLADRLGLVDIAKRHSAAADARKQSKKSSGRRPGAGATGSAAYTGGPSKPTTTTRPPPRKKQTATASQLTCCFCFSIPIEQVDEKQHDESEKTKPRPKPPMDQPYQQQPRPTYQPQRPSTASYQGYDRPSPSKHQRPAQQQPTSPAKSYRSATSITAQMKDLIPDTLNAATAAQLMAELVRPLAESDEPGYIYMFWLVQDTQPQPPTPSPSSSALQQRQRAPVEAARSLLAPPPPPSMAARGRRASDAVSWYASQSSTKGTNGGSDKATSSMLLKIGRAANVQRRMNQWQRQCGYDVEVLRYYPYASSSSTPTPSPSPSPRRGSASGNGSESPGMMTPHAKRVERLVHIELTGMGLRAEREACEACGREHREWFEVGATREDVRRVDEVIRRWVEWDLSR